VTDRQTDGQTDVQTMAKTREAFHAVARKNTTIGEIQKIHK